MLRKLFPFLREREERWEHLDNQLTHAFDKVRQDTGNLFSWISFFHHQVALNKHETTALQRQVDSHHSHLSHSHTRISSLESEIDTLKRKLELLESRHENAQKQPQTVVIREPSANLVRTEYEPSANLKRPRFEEKMLTHMRTRKKPYVMAKLMESIDSGMYSTKELERIVVEEKGICGRTAFYSYLKELKLKKQIKIEEKGFSKVILRA